VGDSLDGGRFPTTRRSAVLGVRSPDEAERRRSWEVVVSAYWKPAYKHVRLKWRRSPEDASDLVQGFFERALGKGLFDRYEPERARFRTFVRVCLDGYVSNERKAERRLKRGGDARVVSLDFDAAERELAHVDAGADVEALFDREWRRSLFEWGVDALGERARTAAEKSGFEIFRRYDLSDSSERPTYDAIASELGIPVTTVTNQLAWARRELKRLVLERLAELTASPEELSSEARSLGGGV
jgi:RNA polymerase sigma factor (sigma-70 family)